MEIHKTSNKASIRKVHDKTSSTHQQKKWNIFISKNKKNVKIINKRIFSHDATSLIHISKKNLTGNLSTTQRQCVTVPKVSNAMIYAKKHAAFISN